MGSIDGYNYISSGRIEKISVHWITIVVGGEGMNKPIDVMERIENPSTQAVENFNQHPGFRRMFAPDQLTIGLFLPLKFYKGHMDVVKVKLTLWKALINAILQPYGCEMSLYLIPALEMLDKYLTHLSI